MKHNINNCKVNEISIKLNQSTIKEATLEKEKRIIALNDLKTQSKALSVIIIGNVTLSLSSAKSNTK